VIKVLKSSIFTLCLILRSLVGQILPDDFYVSVTPPASHEIVHGGVSRVLETPSTI